jgi:molybdate transport system substrate-binding protein
MSVSTGSEFKVLATTAMSSVLGEWLPAFDRTNHVTTIAQFRSTNRILESMRSGEVADLIIATSGAIDELMRAGKIVNGTRTEFASAGIAVCVRSGERRPDIASVDSLKRALLDAKSIAYSQTGQSGVHFAKVIEQLGITADVKAKTILSTGGLVGEIVARGDAELGVQQTSEILAVSGVDLVAPLPDTLQLISVFAAGIVTGSAHEQASRLMMNWLCSPDGARVMRDKGLTPLNAG